MQEVRAAAAFAFALHRDHVAPIIVRFIAERIGPDETLLQVNVDMGPGPKGWQLPIVLVDQREALGVVAEILDLRDDGGDRLDRLRHLDRPHGVAYA